MDCKSTSKVDARRHMYIYILASWHLPFSRFQYPLYPGVPLIVTHPSITTSVQGGMWGDARMAARRLAWERLARSLLSCVSSSHRSNSVGPNRSRGSISRTTR